MKIADQIESAEPKYWDTAAQNRVMKDENCSAVKWILEQNELEWNWVEAKEEINNIW